MRWVLDLPLTAIDTIPTLAAARVDSFWGVFDVLARELRDGAAESYYYRPLTLISYTFDQWFWGGSAWGYHFTDVTLHALAGVAVFWLGRSAVDLSRFTALVAAVLFLIHPSIIEVVPAIARRQEPLMVIGFCLAVIGARHVPARLGWLTMVLGSVIAVTASERGLVIPGIVFGYLMLYRFVSDASPLRRLLESLRWVMPALGTTVAFFLVRTILYGAGGAVVRAENFFEMPVQFGLWLLYPQQVVDLALPDALGGRALFVAGAAIGVTLFIYPMMRAKRREMLWFATSWIVLYGLFLTFAGALNPWYLYTAVPGLALIIVFFGREAYVLSVTNPSARPRALAAMFAALLLTLSIALPSPLSHEYPAWRVAASLSERFMAELEKISREVPADEAIAVVNLPAHFCESKSDYLVTRSAAILWPSSIRVWQQERGLFRKVLMIGAANLVKRPSVPVIEFEPDCVRIYFTDGESAYTNANNDWPGARRLPESMGRGYEFPWTDETHGLGKISVYVFDGERLVPFHG